MPLKVAWTLTAIAVLTGAPLMAAENVFANPKNLKVLPEDISPERLRQTMLGFSGALNAKCSYCHDVDDDLSRSDPDYSNDDKRTKRIAREMLKLVADINDRISDIDLDPRQQEIEVTCITCHRGQYRPMLILPVLNEARDEGGVDAVIAKYSELRERYFGNHTMTSDPPLWQDLRAALLPRAMWTAALCC